MPRHPRLEDLARAHRNDAAGAAVVAVLNQYPTLTYDQGETVLFLRSLVDGGFHFTGRRIHVTCIDCGAYGTWRYPTNAIDFIRDHAGHEIVTGIGNPEEFTAADDGNTTENLPVADVADFTRRGEK